MLKAKKDIILSNYNYSKIINKTESMGLTEIILILIVLALNIGICYFIAKSGKKRKIGFKLSFFLCIFLSPIIGGIITMLSPKVF
jgi:uncharacterized membrane protein